MQGVVNALNRNIKNLRPGKALEVGCGTGRWLNLFDPGEVKIYGLDYSKGMLLEASKLKIAGLIRGDANALPFKNNLFDLTYCVNAIHHFNDDEKFILDSKKYLQHGGALIIIGLDHHEELMDWYIYDYFNGTCEFDKLRFSSFTLLKKKMLEAGYSNINIEIIDRVDITRLGTEIFSDPFLEKDQSSQLAALSQEEYTCGIDKMRAAIKNNPLQEFRVRFSVKMMKGFAS